MARPKVCRSLYSFSSRYKHALDFTVSERFVVLEDGSDDENWCYAINKQGNIGYIPTSYVEQEQLTMAEIMCFAEEILKLIPTEYEEIKSSKQRRFIMQLTEIYKHYCLQQPPLNSSALEDEDKPAKNEDSTDFVQETNEENLKTDFIVVESINSSEANVTVNSQDGQVQECVNDLILPEENDHIGETVNIEQNNIKESGDGSHCIVEQNSQQNNIKESGDGSHCIVEQNSHVDSETVLSKEEREIIHEILRADVDTQVKDELVKTEDSGPSPNLIETANNPVVPSSLVPSLIEQIRSCTNLSHTKSQLAVATVINCFKEGLPSLMPIWRQMSDDLGKCQIDESILVHGKDRKKLDEIFRQLWYCRNDEQQRSWPVHEDEGIIKGHLEELYRILLDADPRISCQAIQADDYEPLHLLVTYYQMEPRRSLRIAMLQIFIVLCELDQNVIDQLLSSILPTELARDMQSITDDLKRIQYSAYLLTLLFCTGQKPSNYICEYINEKFLEFLLNIIDDSSKGDEDEELVGDQCLAVLLAYNQHHLNPLENPILSAIGRRSEAKVLTEKLMLLVNREDDPTKLLSYSVSTPNSVMKMLSDLFSDANTVQLFYLNDIKVLLDIIVRQLTDLPPGDNRRCHYLNLVGNIIRNSSYGEHCHQQENLQRCFYTILSQDEASIDEKSMIKNIATEHSSWFSLP